MKRKVNFQINLDPTFPLRLQPSNCEPNCNFHLILVGWITCSNGQKCQLALEIVES